AQTFQQLDQWLMRLPTQTVRPVKRSFLKWLSLRPLFLGTACVSLLTAAYGCTQTIAILLTHQLTAEPYRRADVEAQQLALDLENTAVVLSPLVPWNIAGLVPATLLLTDAGFVPYAVYLYLLPLLNLVASPNHPGRPAGCAPCNFVQDSP
ncbi:MAG TPA: Na+/H+ antiporter NhaC family protein, partial [Trichocoleus sp.]